MREICLFRNDDKSLDLRAKQKQLVMRQAESAVWQNRRNEEKSCGKSCTNNKYIPFWRQHVKWIFYFFSHFLISKQYTQIKKRTIDLSTVPLPHPFTFLQWNHLCVKSRSGLHPFPTPRQQIVKTKQREKSGVFLREATGTCLLQSIVMINSSQKQMFGKGCFKWCQMTKIYKSN